MLNRIFGLFRSSGKAKRDLSRAVLLVDMGAPDSQEEYRLYLERLFSDPDVIPAPRPIRWWIRRRIVAKRLVPGWRRYVANGLSPLKRAVASLARSLSAELDGMQVGAAYTFAEPQIPETIAKFEKMGVRELVVVPLHPHSCRASRGAMRRRIDAVPPSRTMQIDVVPPYGDNPLFVRFWERLVKEAAYANRMERPHVLFSAHGIPLSYLKKGETYLDEVRASCDAIGLSLGLEWSLAFQSAVGRGKWTTPSVVDELTRLEKNGAKEVLIAPVTFLAENLETIADLGSELDRSRWPGLKISRVLLPDGSTPCPAQKELNELLVSLCKNAQSQDT